MKKGGVIVLFGFVVLQLAFFSAKSKVQSPSPVENYEPRNYIVYMSEPTIKGESPKERCLRILSSVFPRLISISITVIFYPLSCFRQDM